MLELLAAGTMLVGLVLYALTGGADFGGGIWDLLASGPRKADQRRAVERALAPVWEANHVWLIFVVVVLFTAFPAAFARIGIELHIPLTLLLIGIVFRGAAFVFRQYGAERSQHRWGTVFSVSSTIAAAFLGVVLGALTSGTGWASPFPFAVGALTIIAFAFLAASYLAVEVTDKVLRADFRRRAIIAGISLGVSAAGCAMLARAEVPAFYDDLLAPGPMLAVLVSGAAAMVSTLICLHRRRERTARMCAIATVALLVLGWGVAQYPIVVAPDLTFAEAAAPAVTLRALMPVILVGTLVLLPSLWWLLRVFKSGKDAPQGR